MAELFDILTNDTAQGTATDVGEVWEPLLSLTTPSRPEGEYQVEVAFVPNFPDAVRSFEWRVVGGVVSPEYSHENKDATDYEPFFYGFKIDHLGGSFTATFEAQKEAGGSQLDFDAINLAFRRIG